MTTVIGETEMSKTITKKKVTKKTTVASKPAGLAGIIGRPAAKSTTKKSTVPVLDAESVADAIAEWKVGKQQEVDGKAARISASDDIMPLGVELWKERCKSDNALHSSIQLKSSEGSLKMICPSKCSRITMTDEDADRNNLEVLEAAFGDDFPRLFEVVKGVKLLADELTAAEETKLSTALVKALGLDRAKELLVDDSEIKPTEALFAGKILDPVIAQKVATLVEDGVLSFTVEHLKK